MGKDADAAAIKRALRDNVLALLQRDGGPLRPNETGVTRLTKLGVALGNAQRILNAETNVGLGLLQQLALIFRVQPWQLLVPGLDASAPPGLTVDSTAWPFEMVDRASYLGLPKADRVFVQGQLEQAIKQRAKSVSGKRDAA